VLRLPCRPRTPGNIRQAMDAGRGQRTALTCCSPHYETQVTASGRHARRRAACCPGRLRSLEPVRSGHSGCPPSSRESRQQPAPENARSQGRPLPCEGGLTPPVPSPRPRSSPPRSPGEMARVPVRQPAPAPGPDKASPPPGARGQRRIEPGDRNASPPPPGNRDKTGADPPSERLHAPLVLPGRCPLYVRNHCYASTRRDTP